MSRGLKTEFAGVTFRSRPEAMWAMFFTLLGLEWQYEPKTFIVGSTTYTPDFYLPASDLWVEVKPTTGNLKDYFNKYVDATGTVLSESKGLLILGEGALGYSQGVMFRVFPEKYEGTPIHKALVPNEESESGVIYGEFFFESDGPRMLDPYHLNPVAEYEDLHNCYGTAYCYDGNDVGVQEDWTSTYFCPSVGTSPSVMQAYGQNLDALLDCNAVNVANKEQHLSTLTNARVRGLDILLSHLNEAYEAGIVWEFVDSDKSVSRKREWHVSNNGQPVKTYLVKELEDHTLRVYAKYNVPLPLAQLRNERKPGYIPYLQKKLEKISKTIVRR